MSQKRNEPNQDSNPPNNLKKILNWSEVVSHLLYRKQKARALKFLDKIIEKSDLPLFRDPDDFDQQRRLAWLYKINLFQEWGKPTDALAWVCLACELQPNNVEAFALKERLKRKLGLTPLFFPKAEHTEVQRHYCSWEGVAGMREVKAMLERDVILPLQEPEIYKRYRVSLPNGVLLYGPPGCGKTYIARHLARELSFNFIEIKPSDLASIYVHGSQEKIGKLFKEAREEKPSLIFFDEIDALVPKREGQYHSYAAEVNEFLVHLNESWKNGILVVGATNVPGKIDPAVLRPGRLDKKVFIGPPDFEARVELLKFSMQDRPQEKMDFQFLSQKLVDYSCAEIDFLIDEAARKALEERRKIKMDDITDAAKENPTVNTPESIEQMKKIY